MTVCHCFVISYYTANSGEQSLLYFGFSLNHFCQKYTPSWKYFEEIGIVQCLRHIFVALSVLGNVLS